MVQPLWKRVWNKRKIVPCRGNTMSTGKESARMESVCRALLRDRQEMEERVQDSFKE